MWKKRYILAVGLCLLPAGWFLSQALYHRNVVQHAASQDTEAHSAPVLKENNTKEESQAIKHTPVQADEPSQKMTPLPAARPTAAARVRKAQTAAMPAHKETLTAPATHQPAQELIPQADRPVACEFPASVEETTNAKTGAAAAMAQVVDISTIANAQTRIPLSAAISQPFAQVEADGLAFSTQPADSSAIAAVLPRALAEEAAEPQSPVDKAPGAKVLVLSTQPADSSAIAAVLPRALAEEAAEPQSPVDKAPGEIDAEAVAFSTQPEDTLAIKTSGKTALSVVAQNRADVDEEKIYEDILNLIKSKMALNQSIPTTHAEPAIVLASREPATTNPAPGLRPIQQLGPATHGIGLALGTAQPDMAEKVRTPIFVEMHYRYQSTRRTQLQVAAGATPLFWPEGSQTLQISADLIGRYGLIVHRRIQPNLSFGLGMLSTRMQNGPSLASGTLLAGGGVNLSLAQPWNLGVQVQYKYCLQNPASASSMQRDGYLQIKTELTFNLRQLNAIRLQSEENYLAEKQ